MSRCLACLAFNAPSVMSDRPPVAQVPEPLAQQSSILIQSLLHWEFDLAEEGSLLSPALLSVLWGSCPLTCVNLL